MQNNKVTDNLGKFQCLKYYFMTVDIINNLCLDFSAPYPPEKNMDNLIS